MKRERWIRFARAGALLLAASLLLLVACARRGVNPPVELAIVEVVATSSTSLQVTFDKALGSGAENPNNYQLSGPDGSLAVLAAYVSEDGFGVTLGTAEQRAVSYQLSVRNIGVANRSGVAGELSASAVNGSTEKAPQVASAIAISNTEVLITFVDPNSAKPEAMGPGLDNPAYYEITPPLAVTAATPKEGGTMVLLETAPQEQTSYTVKVTNVLSKSGGKLVDPQHNTAGFNGIPGDDIAPPTITDVFATDNTTVVLRLSEPVSNNAGDPRHYGISNTSDLAVLAAELSPFNTEVVLTTALQSAGTLYTLTISEVTDQNGNPFEPPDNSATFTGVGPGSDGDVDGEGLKVTGAVSNGNTGVVVAFNKTHEQTSAENTQHYNIFADLLNANELSSQAILNITSATLRSDGSSVLLTTGSQSPILYTLQVAGITDLLGNPIAPQEPLTDPFNETEFFGTPATGDEIIDTDGDGLPDNEELKGWTVTVELLERTVLVPRRTTREVHSDPGDPTLNAQVDLLDNACYAYGIQNDATKCLNADGTTRANTSDGIPDSQDTDLDGMPDPIEKDFGLDPTDFDTDDDGLTDFQEFNETYSNPFDQDTDEDGIEDGLEEDFFKTSSILADTDGDQFDDFEEVVIQNRNPRLADLPRVQIDVGNVDLRLNVIFEEQSSQGTSELESRSVETTFTQSEASARSESGSSTFDWFVQGTATGCYGGACASGGDKLGNWGVALEVSGGVSSSSTSSWTDESSRAAQREYSSSLSSDVEVSAESVVTRFVESATMGVEVNLLNAGNISFTISDIEITALVQDPRNPREFVPVASLFAASGNPISIGPLTPARGPFRFEASDAFPSLVESLMQNPRGMKFEVASYEIEDEFGRKFAFVEQDINDRTAFLEIDYAGNLDRETYRVATNSPFDSSGEPTGLTMQEVMEDVLGLTHVDLGNATGDPPSCSDPKAAADLETTYATCTIRGVEALWRVRNVSKALSDVNRDWWVITPEGLITPVPNAGFAGRDFNSTVVFSDQAFAFKFIQDLDDDLLEATEEAFYRSIDSDVDTAGDPDNPDSKDTDDDGIRDDFEVYGVLDISTGNRTPWIIRPEDGRDAFTTFSNPGRADTDLDGLTDCQELIVAPSCSAIQVYRDANDVPTLDAKDADGNDNTLLATVTLTKPTDPSSPDSDNDGLTDAQEVAGFRYNGLTGVGGVTTIVPSGVSGCGNAGGSNNVFCDSSTPYATNPLHRDTDQDGLADFQELQLGTILVRSDGDSVLDDDGDGLVNLQETQGWSISKEGRSTTVGSRGAETSSNVTSLTNDPDSDDDGLTDWEEFMGCRDREGDLVCDTDDRFGRTDPKSKDTDGDNLTDRQEVDSVDFPGDAESPFRFTNPVDADSDDDTRSDGDEVNSPWPVNVVGQGGLIVFSDPLDADADLDGLTDSIEYTQKSDPNNADTDGDGVLDGLESTRPTDILEPDFLVTVTYLTIRIFDDCDSTGKGEFDFGFGVELPHPTKGLEYRSVVSRGSILSSLLNCPRSEACKTNSGWVEMGDGGGIDLNRQTQFGLPFTELFTLKGFIGELDRDDDNNVVFGMKYDFGGPGTPDAVFDASNLSQGSFTVLFADPPDCDVTVSVLVKVE
ncbi:MAG: hypothetical protein JSV66_02970 [Trueperaceae bacterium]|nr:MAG: hypothetical protein JSV66_02970 [Trueperaceae bacterium]